MGFNIVFSCSYEVDADCIKYALESKTFNECFTDDDIITCDLVERIVACDEALKFLVEKLDDDEYIKDVEISCDETPEDSFCGIVEFAIKNNLDAIKTILEDCKCNEGDDECEKSDESEDVCECGTKESEECKMDCPYQARWREGEESDDESDDESDESE
jgi:hypothetical protein